MAARTGDACEDDARYRSLEFLLGEWRLVSNGEEVGRSRVEKLEDGCLIAETWSFGDGRSGRTYSSFDRAAGVWRRFGVSNRGVVVRSSGMVDGGVFMLRGERVSAEGEASAWRERWAPDASGRIRVSVGGSPPVGSADRGRDGLFDGYYEPASGTATLSPATAQSAAAAAEELENETPLASAREAAPPAPPEPAPEPAEAPVHVEPGGADAESASAAPTAGEVRPASARATDAERIERIAMASPMVLRLPLGAVEALPRDYAWITRDTAPYLCDGVTIERVEVERRRRRGQVELKVALAVHGRQVSKAVDVSVDLERSGQSTAEAVVASGRASSRVGRSIPEQVQYGSVAVVVTLSMDAEVFDSVVADAERPDLVITLAVGR